MFIKVTLERIFELEGDSKDIKIDEIKNMEDLELLDYDAITITTELKSISLMTDDEIEKLREEDEDRPDDLHNEFMKTKK